MVSLRPKLRRLQMTSLTEREAFSKGTTNTNSAKLADITHIMLSLMNSVHKKHPSRIKGLKTYLLVSESPSSESNL